MKSVKTFALLAELTAAFDAVTAQLLQKGLEWE
jgi:hypothetical protein